MFANYVRLTGKVLKKKKSYDICFNIVIFILFANQCENKCKFQVNKFKKFCTILKRRRRKKKKGHISIKYDIRKLIIFRIRLIEINCYEYEEFLIEQIYNEILKCRIYFVTSFCYCTNKR